MRIGSFFWFAPILLMVGLAQAPNGAFAKEDGTKPCKPKACPAQSAPEIDAASGAAAIAAVLAFVALAAERRRNSRRLAETGDVDA